MAVVGALLGGLKRTITENGLESPRFSRTGSISRHLIRGTEWGCSWCPRIETVSALRCLPRYSRRLPHIVVYSVYHDGRLVGSLWIESNVYAIAPYATSTSGEWVGVLTPRIEPFWLLLEVKE